MHHNAKWRSMLPCCISPAWPSFMDACLYQGCSRGASHPLGLQLRMHVCTKGAPVLHLTCFTGRGTNSASDLPSSPSPTDRNTHKGPLGYSGFLREKNTPWSALILCVAATCLVIPVEDLGEAIFVGAGNRPQAAVVEGGILEGKP